MTDAHTALGECRLQRLRAEDALAGEDLGTQCAGVLGIDVHVAAQQRVPENLRAAQLAPVRDFAASGPAKLGEHLTENH